MCLLLGPPNVGKSLLLEKLGNVLQETTVLIQKNKSYENIPTKPSIKRIIFSCGKRSEIGIIEPENCFFSCWVKYLVPHCSSILFMIDSTNRRQISDAYILLLKVLSFPLTNKVPILILLNKCDMGDSMTRAEVEAYFHLKDIASCIDRKQGNIAALSSFLCVNDRLSEVMAPECSRMRRRQINVLECSCMDGTGLPFILSWLQQNVDQ